MLIPAPDRDQQCPRAGAVADPLDDRAAIDVAAVEVREIDGRAVAEVDGLRADRRREQAEDQRGGPDHGSVATFSFATGGHDTSLDRAVKVALTTAQIDSVALWRH
mgnify:CR=1 FL=1